jgi:hypothetical protein
VTAPRAGGVSWHSIMDANPQFRRAVTDFMMCLDAKRVLERRQPPVYETAAAYLEEVGLALIRETGLPEEFIQACVASMPPQD